MQPITEISNSFFPEPGKNEVNGYSNQDSSEFKAALNSAETGAKKAAPKPTQGNRADSTQSTNEAPFGKRFRMDNPKVFPEEPFFPELPVPYHPEPSLARVFALAQAAENGSLAEGEGNGEAGGVFHFVPASTNGPGVEDTEGLTAKSYSGSVVSYPITQIASQSFDQQTLNQMKAMGVDQTPVMIGVKPSAEMITMANVLESKKMGVEPTDVGPITQFMASMESEVGVEPERLVQALRNIPEKGRFMTASKAVSKMIHELDLTPEQELKTIQLSGKMVAALKHQREQKDHNALLKSFTVGSLGAAAKEASGQAGSATAGSQSVAAAAYEAPQGFQISPNAARAQAHYSAMNAESGQVGQQANAFSGGQSKGFENQFGQENSFTTGGENMEMGSISSSGGEESLGDFAKTQGAFSSSKVESLSSTPSMNRAMPMEASTFSVGAPKSADPNAQLNELSQRVENVQNLTSNVRTLASRGGGEMSMTLNPENLGEVQLKVAVNNGNVEVKMVAERPEVKVLLEQNMNELKSGLTQQNLSMEKIEVALQDKSMEFEQGRQEQQLARDFQQQYQNQKDRGTDDRTFDDLTFGLGMDAINKPEITASHATQPRSGVSSGRLNVVA